MPAPLSSKRNKKMDTSFPAIFFKFTSIGAPAGDTRKAKRDRAILATLLYHALRRGERKMLCIVAIDGPLNPLRSRILRPGLRQHRLDPRAALPVPLRVLEQLPQISGLLTGSALEQVGLDARVSLRGLEMPLNLHGRK